MWERTRHHAYTCRFGRQSYTEILGRRPTPVEWSLFEKAIEEILSQEYASKPAELRTEDE